MSSKVRCGFCKRYVPKDVAIRNGVQSFCSWACVSDNRNKPKKPGKKKPSTDIPLAARKATEKRDHGQCRWCRTRSGTQLHHVIYRSEGEDHQVHNLLTLCQEHHDTVHSNKKLYQPLCLGVIWMVMVEGKDMTVPTLQRWLNDSQG